MTHLFFRAFLSLGLFLGAGTLTQAQDQSRQIVTFEDSDYFGFDLKAEKDVSLEQCTQSCIDNNACAAFTYNASARFCFLKTDFGELQSFPNAIAGHIVTIDKDLGAPSKLAFIPQHLHNKASVFLDTLKSDSSQNANQGARNLAKRGTLALSDNQPEQAIKFLAEALKLDPKVPQTWISLSNAAAQQAQLSRESRIRRTNREMAISAALNGYKNSRTAPTRADTLAKLAKGLELDGYYRPALSAYKESLTLNETLAERDAFNVLREAHGFRVLNHSIDSDSRTPRLCIQFSETLDTQFQDYENYIRIDQQVPKAIDVSAEKLCVEGLEHGKNYTVNLRQGLPSTIDEQLLTNANLDIYIRDRSPAVRFTGNNFVLPLANRHGIPLVTINADHADLELYRIGQRALAPLLRDSHFLKQLSSYQVDYLMEDLGEPVWNGTLDIATKLNRETTTSIPIDDALPQRQPGIYLLTAKPVTNNPGGTYARATQWFVISDIGLTSFSSTAELQIFTRSLETAQPIASIDVTLIARNNEVLATGTSDANGQVSFDPGFMRGTGGLAPAFISAARGAGEFTFLDITKAGFDFSDRGVTGRLAPKGIDVYTWTERGIYRAGETVHVAALARDPQARAIADLPLTFIFERPDGVEDQRMIESGATLGGYAVDLALTENAQRGTWRVRIFADPKKPALAEQFFLVEDFLPERTEFTLTADNQTIAQGKSTALNVSGQYLYGAPAAGLGLEASVSVQSKRTRAGFSRYVFGLATSEAGGTQRFDLTNIANLDENGNGIINVTLPATRATTRPQSATVTVRMREDSGRTVAQRTTLDIVPSQTMIGIRPNFTNGQIAEGSIAEFNLIAVDPTGAKTDIAAANWSLVKVERHYQWYKNGNNWHYESVDLETQIADGTLALSAAEPAKFTTPVDWGHYRLDVESPALPDQATSIDFYAGWYVTPGSTDTPDGLELALDKQTYKAGDIAKLKVSPRFAGELHIAIGTDRIEQSFNITVPAIGTTVDIPVAENWGAGAYILATLYRPSDAAKSRMPARAIGVKWLTVDPDARTLNITLDAPTKAKPNQPLSIPVHVTGLNPGEEAYVTLAAVDVGILNLTRYKSPDPLKRYFGQRQLGLAMRDIYGRLIDGSLGATGNLRTGGDSGDGFGSMSADGNAPTQKLVSFFSGIVKLDNEGRTEISFDMPQFNGTTRLMATAWTKDSLGASEQQSIIRDPIVIAASLPKFIAPGDTSRLLVELTNTDAPDGNYDISLTSSDNLSLDLSQIKDSVTLTSGRKSTLTIPVTATNIGDGWASIHLSSANDISITHDITLPVRAAQPPVTMLTNFTLNANGGSTTIDASLLAGSKIDGATIAINVALPSAFDVSSLLLQLNRYPYGCAEQTTSKALPLLYVKDFTTDLPDLNQETLESKIQTAISTVLAYQSYEGGFSLWGNSLDDQWLTAYIADFLTRAAEQGYAVPEQPMKQAINALRNMLTYQNNLDTSGTAIAYSLYVLARNKLAAAGDLRYYADTQLANFKTPIARAHIAAALALYGDQQRAETSFESALELAKSALTFQRGEYDFGSALRDSAAMLTLANEARPAPGNLAEIKQLAQKLARLDAHTNTQEQAWMLLAARSEKAANANITLEINGQSHTGIYAKNITGTELTSSDISLTNIGDQPVQATVTTLATPNEPLPAQNSGFSISRAYFTLDGEETDISTVSQNQRFVTVITLKQLNDMQSRFIVNDLLPAGFEIENPHLTDYGTNRDFDWISGSSAVHTEFRDDRFTAAFNRNQGGQNEFTLAYTVRAVTPGTYAHPAVTVQDMYRPQQFARSAVTWVEVLKAN